MERRGLTLLALLMTSFVINIDTTIVNVTLPALSRQLGATSADLQWVVDAYNLVFAALVLVMGSLSDRLGRKGMLLVGLGVFGAASLSGSFGANAQQLIAARAVMGIGAAMMFPSTLSILTNVFTDRKQRAKAIGLWGAVGGIGIALGPIIGGSLLEHFWWGSIFLFLAPVAGVIAVVAAWQVPASRDPGTPPVDWRGFALSTAGMGLLVLGVIQAPGWGWGSPAAIATIAAGVLLLASLALAERRAPHPMLDVGLFRNPRFTAASGSIAIAFFALMGFIFLMTQYFQVIKAYPPLATGVRLLPLAMSVGIFSVIGTRLAVRVGNKIIVSLGLLCYCASFVWAATISQATSYGTLAAQMAILGIGMGLTSPPATESIMGAVSNEKAGIGSAVNDATRLFGATFGVAVIGSIAASLYNARLGSTIPPGLPAHALSAARGSVGGAVTAAQHLSSAGLTGPAHDLASAAILAYLHGLAGGCAVAAAITAAGVLLPAGFLPSKPQPPASTAGPGSDMDRFLTAEPKPGRR